jgi:hypothetical protein
MAWQYWGIGMGDPTDSGLFRLDVWNELISAFDERAKELYGPDAYITVKDTSAPLVPQVNWRLYVPVGSSTRLSGAYDDTPFQIVNLLVPDFVKIDGANVRQYGDAGWTYIDIIGEFWANLGTGVTEAELQYLDQSMLGAFGNQVPTRRVQEILRSAASELAYCIAGYNYTITFNKYAWSYGSGTESLIGTGTPGNYEDISNSAGTGTRIEVEYSFPATSKMFTSAGFPKVLIYTRQRSLGGASAYAGGDRLDITADGSGPSTLDYPACGAAPDSEEVETLAIMDTVGGFTVDARASNYAGTPGDETLESRIGTAGRDGAFKPGWDYP